MKKKALVCGISGQDGAYLANLLLKQGYIVFGTSRDAQISSFHNLVRLGIKDKIQLLSMSLIDFRSVLYVIKKTEPDEIYNLAGQSSVGLSFEQPVETIESITIGTINLLEAIRFINKKIRFYNASSSECFGNIKKSADEETLFQPRSPYAASKAAAHWIVANYRESYDLYACSGILFNHESPLRPDRFVTQKIIAAAKRIAKGSTEKLYLGNISISRDWGWAPEFVEAMYLMLQQKAPEDFVIATGESHKLEDFVNLAFSYYDLCWQDFVRFDNNLLRPTDIAYGLGNPRKAEKILGWKSRYKLKNIITQMLEDRLY